MAPLVDLAFFLKKKYSHLHGHKFMIVGRSEDYTSTDPALNPPIVEGQPNPIRRDTVQIGGGTSATLRIVADNPGVWLFHCKFFHSIFYLCPGLLHHRPPFFSFRQVTSNGISNPVSSYNSSKHLYRPKKLQSPPSLLSSIPNAPLLTCLTPAMLQGTTLRLI